MKRLLATVLLLLLVPMTAMGGEETVWTLMTEDGQRLTAICYEPETGDRYLSADNTLYEIIRVEGDTAVARSQGPLALPDISWLEEDAALPVSAAAGRRIALYCTHSDESYKPSDGTYSDPERGSIYQVAAALADALEEKGATCEVSDALHYPHDAGAYRRSRQTAVQLLKSGPDALLDIHRDGIPDPEEYTVTIGGRQASKVRLLVGRGNQNMEVNKDFALTVKAVADRVYPGLIKDIYMGKGTYNQDLAPHSLLLECGTYTLSRDRVLVSMPMMADVLDRALYGGVTGSAGASDVRSSPAEKGGITPGATDAPVSDSSRGTGSGLLWLVVIAVAALVIYGIVSTGSFGGGMRKIGRNINEMSGGLIGKKPDGEDKPPET